MKTRLKQSFLSRKILLGTMTGSGGSEEKFPEDAASACALSDI